MFILYSAIMCHAAAVASSAAVKRSFEMRKLSSEFDHDPFELSVARNMVLLLGKEVVEKTGRET